MFKCNKCGECCRNLDKSLLYNQLHDGDGICRYLEGNLCSIYETRPILCQVDKSYDLYFKELMTRQEYEKLNYEACKNFKKLKEE